MKRKVWSILLALCMVMAMMPAAAFADSSGSASVTTEKELNAALKDSSVTEIHVTKDLKYTDTVQTDKKIVIKSGATLTWSVYKNTFSANPLEIEDGATLIVNAYDFGSAPAVLGTITNHGTITTQGKGYCYWEATTTGDGTFTGTNQTYINYGCMPDTMRTDSVCRINIVKDVAVQPTVSLPENMTVGDTITPTVTNLIDGVDISKVFTYKWKSGNGSERYNGAANPTLTGAGTLSLNLSVNRPYVMRTSSGTTGSIDASGTVQKKLYDTIYVDATNGNDSNIGSTETSAVKTLDSALKNVAENGTIIILSDCSLKSVSFTKNVTIKSNDDQKYALTTQSAYPAYIENGVTATFDSVDLSNTLFTRSDQSSAETGNLVFNSCIGTNMSIGSGDINNITLDHSQLGGTLTAGKTLTMKASTFDGQFFTRDFIAEGDCSIIIAKKNAPCEVEGTIATQKPVTIIPKELKSGEKLIEVPNDSGDSIAANFQLQDTQKGLYTLKCRKVDNRTYIGVSAQVIGQEVTGPANNQSGFNSIYCTIKSATWSGYDETTNTWKLGDTPKLTVVLKTGTSNDQFFHFGDAFDVTELKVYSWKDLKEMADFTEAALNSDVTCKVEDGQGVSDDGRTFTFTIQYPEVTRLDQTIKMDTSDRTATCGEELDAREATAKTTLSYESSDPEIASVDPATGKITAHKAGEVTITVKAAQSDLYNAAESHYKLTVSHKFSDTWKHDETSHWKDCVCGAKGEEAHHSGGEATCTKTAECNICGTKYGNIDPNNHSRLKHVEATAATQDKEGNIEYWYCENCGKYFRDEAAKEEINKEDTITAKLPPSSDNNQKPGDSSQNDQNGQKPDSTNADNGAKTGDAMPIGLLAVLMLAAGAGIAFCGRKLYKSR